MKIPFFVTIRAGVGKSISAVIKSTSRESLEQKIKRQSSEIEIITIIPVCQVQEMCK
jgi:hypothetical protein